MAKGVKTGGRIAGTPNQTTVIVKEALQAVYTDLQESVGGEHEHFRQWAEGNPTEFYKLFVRLLPTEIKANLSEVPAPLQITVMRFAEPPQVTHANGAVP